jgi:restriction endonuclease S subunit
MLPEGWKRYRLDEIGSVITGNTPPTNDAGNYGGAIPFITPGDIGRGKYLYTAERTLSENGVKHARLLPVGSVVVTCIGSSIGKIGLTTQPSASNQQINAIVTCENHDPEYLYYQLEFYSEALQRLAGTQAVPIVNKTTFEGVTLRFPHFKDEEAEIADVLKTWDAAIAVTEKLLVNSRDYWLALTGELLMPVPISTQRRAGSFPPSVQAGIPKLPPTPKGWRKVALGAHLHEITRPVSLVPDDEYTLVTVRRSRGGVDKRSVLLGSEIRTPTQFFVAAGDFLISKRQIVHGACGIVPAELDGAVVSNEYAVLGGDGEIDPHFLRYLSETTYFQQTCFHSSIGVHVEKMLFRTEQWLKRPFNIPPLDEQRRIVEILNTARQQMALAEQQLALFRAEKRALMQQLLTGKRRVRLPEHQMVEA